MWLWGRVVVGCRRSTDELRVYMGVEGSMLSGLEAVALRPGPKMSYGRTERENKDGPLVNSSESRNWAKKSSSTQVDGG